MGVAKTRPPCLPFSGGKSTEISLGVSQRLGTLLVNSTAGEFSESTLHILKKVNSLKVLS
jgi:hypothetical protein